MRRTSVSHKMRKKNGVISLIMILAVFLIPNHVLASETNQFVYYGFVPVGTDAGDPNGYPKRNIDELINGKIYNYTPPEETALLDVIGIHDDTHVEIWDILGKQELASKTVNGLEKWTSFIKFGSFFKVVADKRVSVYQNGGYYAYWSPYTPYIYSGDTAFYPSDEGGFVGKGFTFIAPAFPDGYIAYKYGSNFLATALEDTHVTIYDSTGKDVVSLDLKQGSSLPYNQGRLVCRVNHGAPTGGGGNSIIFHAESSGLIAVRTLNQRSFLAVPAATGGFVGKLFVTPAVLAVDEAGAEEVVVIVPVEPGKVSIYDNKMNLLAEKTLTQADVDAKGFWYHSFGKSSRTIIIKSTCKMTVLEGSTYVPAELGKTTIGIEDLGSNIAFVGARANEETRFYVPTTAVVFAPADLTAEIDGETKNLMEDQFVLLDSGVHSVTPDNDMIIQLNCAGNMMHVDIYATTFPGGVHENLQESKETSWTDWGNYLITVEDVRKMSEVPAGFAETAGGGMDWTMIIAAVVVVAAAAAGGFFVLKRRKSST